MAEAWFSAEDGPALSDLWRICARHYETMMLAQPELAELAAPVSSDERLLELGKWRGYMEQAVAGDPRAYEAALRRHAAELARLGVPVLVLQRQLSAARDQLKPFVIEAYRGEPKRLLSVMRVADRLYDHVMRVVWEEHLRSREALARVSQTRYQLIFDHSPEPMWIWDMETLRFVDVNEAALRQYGYTRDEFLALRVADLFPPERRGELQARLRASESLPTTSQVIKQQRKDGSQFEAETRAESFDLEGKQVRLVVLNDITLQVRTEEARRAAETRFARLSESGIIGIVHVDFDGRVLDVNDALVRLLGYRREELLSGAPSWTALTPPEWRTADAVAMDALRVAGVAPVREKELLRRDGSRVPVLVGAAALHADGGDCLAFVLDLTERKRAELELRRLTAARAADERFRALLEAAPDAMLIVDDSGRIVIVNAQAEATFGYRREEMLGKPIEMLVPERARGGHGGHRSRYHAAPTKRLMAESVRDLVGVRKDGSEFAAEISLSPIDTPEGLLVTAAVRDVTARRQLEDYRRKTESRELEEQHRRTQEANRLKSEFLANMSHELRTPLNAIIGFAELMYKGKVGPVSPDHQEFLGDIVASSRHLLQLINEVLDLAKVESGKLRFEPQKLELAEVVGEVRDILRGLARDKHITVETEIDPRLPPALLDPGKLKQVLYNYLSNALKFTPEGGKVCVRVVPEPGERFRIEVKDTGIGIRSEDLNRLFVEFQQLDASAAKKYPGTGLGLALTKRLVEAQGGAVGVRSVFGEGSSFSASLPLRFAGEERYEAPRAGAGGSSPPTK